MPRVVKPREFSELVIVFIVEDKADLLVRFKEVADHAGVVKHLFCALANLLWKGAVEM